MLPRMERGTQLRLGRVGNMRLNRRSLLQAAALTASSMPSKEGQVGNRALERDRHDRPRLTADEPAKWRRRESNPRPKTIGVKLLHA